MLTFKEFLKQTLIAFGVIILLDSLWLGVLAKNFYAKELGHIITQTNIVAGIFVWALLAVGAVFFVLLQVQKKTSLHVFAFGALFGAIVYGVYDLTNMVFMNWPLLVTLVDLCWGAVLCGVATVLACRISQK